MAQDIARWNPFAEIDELRRRFFGDGGMFRMTPAAATDIYTEGDDTLVVEVQLPAFDEKDISVTVDRGALVVQAERHEKDEKGEKKERNYVLRESSSTFYRRVPLPDAADTDAIAASFEKGILKVTVPLAAAPAGAKRIPITGRSK